MTQYSKRRFKGPKDFSQRLKSKKFHFINSTLPDRNLLFSPNEDVVISLFCNLESPRRLKWFEKAKLEWENSGEKGISKVEPVTIQGYTTYL